MIIHVVLSAQTEEKIMRRVRVIYFLRSPLGKSILVEAVCLCAMLGSAVAFTSFKDIVANLEGTLVQGSFFQYVYAMVANTERGFQVLLIGVSATSLYFLWNVGKKIPVVPFVRLVQRPFTRTA